MRALADELRQAFRTLAKTPWLAATAVLTLALGLGAVGAVLSVVRGVVLRPFPYSRPDRIVMVWNRWKDFPKTWLSVSEFRAYRERTKSFQDLGVFWNQGVNLTGRGEARRVAAGLVSPNLFGVLGVAPVLGRTFTWEESVAGKGEVAILGEGLWRRRFAADRGVLGSGIEIDGKRKTVIGVMPEGFRLPLDFGSREPSELWLPLDLDLAGAAAIPQGGGDHSYFGVARLRDGVTAERAGSELRAMAGRLTRDGIYPLSWHFSPLVIPLLDDVLGTTRRALVVLLAAVALVLLIACANVALLLLARGNQRRRELAIRAALGAGRGRLVRHHFMESVALAILGWVLGLLVAEVALKELLAVVGASVPRIGEVTLDLGTMAALALVSLLTALLVGLPPALHQSLIDPQPGLQEGGRTAGLGRGRRRSQDILVAGELALAVVLVIGTGLMIRSFVNLLRVDVGFHARNVLTLDVNPSAVKRDDGPGVARYYHELLARVASVPGVERAAAARLLPLASTMGDWGIRVEGYQPAPGERVKGEWQAVTPGYFEAMGIPLRKGRYFTEADRLDGQPVIIVNDGMARKFWPREDPIGKRVKVGGSGHSPWSTVVGVVGDVRHNGITAEVHEQWYLPQTQFHASTGFAVTAMTLVIETAPPPIQLARPVRAAILAYDPKLPAASVQDLDELLSKAVAQPRITMLLMILCAVLALVLAVVGTYGVIGYTVSQRSHEIGLRMALGAQPGRVLGMVVRQGLAISLLGLAMGEVAAIFLTRFLAGLLFGVGDRDPTIFAGGAVVLLLVAIGASLLPARRAAGIDPAIALRRE
jgi:predicted permease